MGYFKSIHNIVFDLLKLIDVYSLHILANMIFNNVVYATINNHFSKTNFNYDVIKYLNFSNIILWIEIR